ncbi:MAG TPA: Pycsar system effector family protein [Caulobacteraceae bacterium]|nr:Pycsar system effector family protein [Caulobacteraceae bacterium]
MTAGRGAAAAREWTSEHNRFADFERGVLQDNIALCDTKAGLLLAFTGAMVIVCIDTIVNVRPTHGAFGGLLGPLTKIVLLLAAGGFLVSSQFSLTTVLPRIVRGREDHIFWESPVFRLPVEDYVAALNALDPAIERAEQLRHLHLLAGICRSKFQHFRAALRLGQIAFLALVAGELLRAVA